MTPLIAALFSLTVLLDVAGQVCFKFGLEHLPGRGQFRMVRFWAEIFASGWLWCGIGAYALELVLWLAVLANARLSVVFPLASLSYCGVLLAGRFVLGERVTRRRWLGAGLITAGVAIICVATQT